MSARIEAKEWDAVSVDMTNDESGSLDSLLVRLDAQRALDAPPLVPEDPREWPELSVEQWRFLWLHARKLVVRWQWHWGETVLRAHAEHGDTATISRAGVDDLVARGFMHRIGCASHALTMEGIRVAK